MKLWLLLFPVCVLGFPSIGDVVDHWRRKNDTEGAERPGILSASVKEKLKKSWGFDLEDRKARLQRLQRRTSAEPTQPRNERFQQKLAELAKVNVTKNEEGIFELNKKAGIADYLYQGDIVLSEQQLEALEGGQSTHGRVKRQADKTTAKWTDGKLYFYFDGGVDERTRAGVRRSHQYISSRTCIDFIEDSTAANKVRVISGNGCYSNIGMWGGQYDLSLGPGCQRGYVAGHEFMHALGVHHQQSRSDRHNYVTVNMDVVSPDHQHNFDQEFPGDLIVTNYEYGSVMHYGATDFVNKTGAFAIVPNEIEYLHTMGNVETITFFDLKLLNSYYGCDAKCPPATSAKCVHGEPNPRNCAVCYCPSGYEGDLCDKKPACGPQLTATPNWQTTEITLGNAANGLGDVFEECSGWITSPPNTRIEVQIFRLTNPQCNYGCNMNGIEFKVDDARMTNPRYCCPEFNYQIIRSYLNPTPVTVYNRHTSASFMYQYRYVDAAAPDFTQYLVPLKRYYKPSGGFHRFHTNEFYDNLWSSDGMTLEGSIGSVLSPALYAQNKAAIDAKCGSLVLMRSFFNPYMVLTPDAGFANALKNTGWTELPYVGYCSSTPACGASRPLRSVSAQDGSTSVYSTDSNEIDVLNTFDRFKGTASGILCYLF